MRWTTRSVLATTAGLALAGAGAGSLHVAYAADTAPSPAPASVVSPTGDDPQVGALVQEARDLQAQVVALQQAVADESAAVRAPGAPAASSSSLSSRSSSLSHSSSRSSRSSSSSSPSPEPSEWERAGSTGPGVSGETDD